MKRVVLISIIILLIPLFSFEVFAGTELKINYAIVDSDNETLILHGINFDIGELNIKIGDSFLSDCNIGSTQVVCSLIGNPALAGGTWVVSVSAGNAPQKNAEIDIFIPTGLNTSQCNSGDFVKCYSGDPSTMGIGGCKEGTRHCDSGTWSDCEGEIIPEPEICDDSIDNDCDGKIDLSDSDCCDDNDGDGYGTGPFCLGPDCDDTNANIPGSPCDGPDLDSCTEGTWVCDGDTPSCSDTTGDNIEICNGKDDDCDGQVDEGAASLCDDGLTCTDDACRLGNCEHSLRSGTCKIDGVCYNAGQTKPGDSCRICNPSNSQSYWSLKNCDYGNPCMIYSCDPASGCTSVPKICDDGKSCTNDYCSNGTCIYNENCNGGTWYNCGFSTCYSEYRCGGDGNCYAPSCCF